MDPKSFVGSAEAMVAVCPCGGPVAAIDVPRSERKRLCIFTPSFRVITELALGFKSIPAGMWWTMDNEPVVHVLTTDGLLVSIAIRPEGRPQVDEVKFKIGRPIIGVAVGYRTTNVVSVVCLTDNMQFFQISMTGGGAQLLKFSPTEIGSVTCFAVIDASRLLVAQESGSLVLLDRTTGEARVLIEGSNEPSLEIQLLSVSLTGSFVASYTANGAVSVYAVSDLGGPVLKAVESSLLDIGLRPSNLCWVGDDCLCLVYADSAGKRNVLFLGGVGGSWSPYEHDSRIHISSDLLSASVLTSTRFQVIQRVCQATLNIATPNSTAPETLLLNGFLKHNANDLQSESIIRSVKDQLDKAVNACAEAAAFETPFLRADEERIRNLLGASIFGRQFCNTSTVVGANLFVNAAALIRLCAAVNDPMVGIPISVPQIMALGPRTGQGGGFLVHMLACRGMFLLAQRIAKWLSVPNGVVINRWACALIGASDHLPDRELCEIISQRVPKHHSLSDIARFAYKDVGRKNLATLLLAREPDVTEQVGMLLNLDSDELAIQKALAGEDVDLVHICFDSLIGSQKSLHELITAKSASLTEVQVGLMLSLVQARYYGENKFDAMCKLLQTIPGAELLLADSAIELALSKYRDIFPSPTIAKIEESADWIQYAAERFAEGVSAPSVVGGTNVSRSPQGCQSTASLLAECSQLIKAQLQLEKTAASKGWPRGPHRFVGLSFEETLRKLILLNEIPEAESLRSKRKISDGKWWELRVRTLLLHGKLEDGLGFANAVPVPNSDCRGFKVVVETLLSMKREDLALPYIKKLKTKKQVEVYNQLGLFEEARAAEMQRPMTVPGAGLLGKLASGIMGSRS
jgi:hypothetical protein